MDTVSSDTWVLLAILYGGGQEGKALREIIGAADYINHAIPGYEELEGGLARLAAAGLVARRGGRYLAGAGVVARYNDLAARHRRLWPVWEELERHLQVSGPAERTPGTVLPRAAYDGAVGEYLRAFRQ